MAVLHMEARSSEGLSSLQKGGVNEGRVWRLAWFHCQTVKGGHPASMLPEACPAYHPLGQVNASDQTAPLSHLSGSMRRMWIHSGYQPHRLKRSSMKLQQAGW